MSESRFELRVSATPICETPREGNKSGGCICSKFESDTFIWRYLVYRWQLKQWKQWKGKHNKK